VTRREATVPRFRGERGLRDAQILQSASIIEDAPRIAWAQKACSRPVSRISRP